MQIDELLELGAADRARLAANFAAVFENNERGNAAYLKARGDLRVVVGIEFGDQDAPGVLVRELVNCRGHRLARCTPVGVEIYEYGNLGIRDHAIELIVIELEGPVQQEKTAALSALGPLRKA